MAYEIRSQGNATIVALSGDVDLDSSPQVRSVLLDSVRDKRVVLVEMSAVSYIDSSGVASLIEAYQTAKSLNTRFGIVGLSGAPLQVIQVAQLEKIFRMYPTVADGVADKA